MGEPLLHGDQECFVCVSPDHLYSFGITMKWERAHFFSCPCSVFLGTSSRCNGEKHAHFGGLIVESILIFVFYGETHANFCVSGPEIR